MNPVEGQAYRCGDLPPGSVVRKVGPTGLVWGSEYVVGRSGCAMRWEQPIPGSEDWQVSYLYQLPPGEWMTDQEWKEVAGTGSEPEVSEGLFAHPDPWMDSEPGTLTLPPEWRQSSGNYKSGFRRYKRNLRWKSTMRKNAGIFDRFRPRQPEFAPCPRCGGQLEEWPDSHVFHCTGCGTKWPAADTNREDLTMPSVAPQHPDPWMDNEPGSTTLPEGW